MKIIGIHGIGHTFSGAEQLKSGWMSSIMDGLSEAGGPSITENDFGMVGYGSVFRPSEMRSVAPPIVASETLDDVETTLLTNWWGEAARLSAIAADPERDEDKSIQGPDFEGRARTPALVQRALKQLAKSRFFKAFGGERMLLFELRQVRRFLHDAEVKKEILARVAAKLSSETRVVLAHSLGSVVAYEALCRWEGPEIDTLITFGSPLGIRNVVFDALTPKPVKGLGIWPRVKRWVNVADKGDIVALEKSLAPLFGSAAVVDKLVYNGWHAHDATRYLNSIEVGEAVAAALQSGNS